jgi:hypothetical protein
VYVCLSVSGYFSPFLLNILMRSSPACSRKKNYLKVFSTELPLSHIEALTSFFGWVVPDDLKLGSISVGISAC